MKRKYISIAGMLLCAGMLLAQSPANRTVKTITADVLAQMPAAEQAQYNQLINDLRSTGEAGVLMLVDMINAPGKGSNAQVEYALSGLTHYVMAKGEEAARLTAAKAYAQALDKVEERETKAFIIRQLGLLGEEESIEPLARYLSDESLSGPAARALAAIPSEKAGGVLVASIMRRMGTPKTQNDALSALADAKSEGAEPLLLTLLEGADEERRRIIYHTLGCIGTKASLETLGEAAQQAGYTMEKTGANDAYIALIGRVATQGNRKEAMKAASSLMKQATKLGRLQTRESALLLLLSIAPENATRQLQQAMKDPDRGYRNAALSFASGVADASLYVELMKTMAKAKPEVKVDLLNWIGRESRCPSKHELIKKLEVRFDLTLQQLLLDQLKEENFEVKQAAVWALTKIGDASMIAPLADLLKSEDKPLVLLAEDALLAFPGDIDQAVARVIPQARIDAGKIAGLELLAARKADAHVNAVLEQTKSTSEEVRQTAYAALKDVVTGNDLTLLCGMLETAGAETIAPIQQAIVTALGDQSAADRVNTINRRMLQAGNKGYLYYKVLASTGKPEALEKIVEGLKKADGASKDAAMDALLGWQGVEAADILLDICRTSSSDQLFNLALLRYVQLVSDPSMSGENRLIRLREAMEIARTNEQKTAVLKQVEKAGTFLALLYAGEFLEDPAVQQASANAVMNIALAHPEYAGKNVRALLERVMAVLDNPDAQYQREAIRKYLNETPDVEGFVSLFNGKDLTGWKGLVENPIVRAKMKPAQLAKAQQKADERMRQDWKVEDGLLVFDGKGFDNLCTDKQYGDFEMYLDWKLDVSGPEADAGVYLRGTPQVQIWDTARVNVGAQVGSGGLYNNQLNESKPTKVADNKLGEWNSFYIKMVGDRVTVLLNGDTVTNDVILENYWDRKQPIFPTEQIELQAHGSKVYYRNIYVKELQRAEPFKLSAEEEKEGFKVLFDGTNMHEWTGNTVDYTMEDGCISMNPSRSFGGNLYTKKEYGNFIYRFEFQLTPGANNGIGIRTPMEGDAAYVGMEIQVLDCEHPIYKNITPLQHHGSVYGIIPALPNHTEAIKPAGEWNTEEILADGDHIRVTVNGVVILDGNIREATQNGTADKLEHPGLFNKKGHIGFLGHGSPVKFRNIRIKELK